MPRYKDMPGMPEARGNVMYRIVYLFILIIILTVRIPLLTRIVTSAVGFVGWFLLAKLIQKMYCHQIEITSWRASVACRWRDITQ